MASRGRIVVMCITGQMPLAGVTWHALQYLLGLRRLGYEVWYTEDNGANAYDPHSNSIVVDCTANVAYLDRVMTRFGLGDRWAYWDAINDRYLGQSRAAVARLYAEADAIINLSNAVNLRAEHLACPVRILIDTDPVYEQIRYFKGGPQVRAFVDAHTHFFSWAENIGGEGWIVPLCGIPWHATRPPVVLDHWPAAPGAPPAFSTIATWENKGRNIEFEGQTYLWSKHTNFLKYLDIPQHTTPPFEMAMRPPSPEIAACVEAAGWRLVDPVPLSSDLDAYQAFIAGSRAEFTVAKDIYARPNSGWSGDRSACYLATGRPVVTMRTGAGRYLPMGEGLIDYADRDEAIAAVEAVNGDYERHSKAARRIAVEYFDSDRVINALLKTAGLS